MCRRRTPWDIENEVGITEGNIFHGELTLDQLLFNRPFPGIGQYRGPFDELLHVRLRHPSRRRRHGRARRQRGAGDPARLQEPGDPMSADLSTPSSSAAAITAWSPRQRISARRACKAPGAWKPRRRFGGAAVTREFAPGIQGFRRRASAPRPASAHRARSASGAAWPRPKAQRDRDALAAARRPRLESSADAPAPAPRESVLGHATPMPIRR